ncbi:MAG TPA: sigma-54 dependent transcriptional regulator [Candidatus Polarisedimenticolaceae bacterium]|nr:sigma-54 dependent transcriptional regulator [Candidatus Polarisedimenticolaceae bacterium]
MDPVLMLVADDEPGVRDSYRELLTREGYAVDSAAHGEEVLDKVRQNPYELVLLDLVFPPTDGVAVLREIKRLRPSTLVVIVTGHATVERVLQAFRAGAYDVVEKPLAREALLGLAARAVEIRAQGDRRRRLAEELEGERLRVLELRQRLGVEDPFQGMVGNSAIVQGLVQTIREVARTDSTVLLTGESGTGKGLVARTIHQASSRRDGPFVEANCVVYSEGVLHSELFGHERGAFTGAAKAKRGRFELATAGTLFLDEIGEIAPATQLLLLRVLQDRAFERVGGEETLTADVRLIAATNRDLQEAIRQGTFRTDLYYRLNVIPVHLPALREHPDDIPLLAQHFLARWAAKLDRPVEGFSDEALEAMVRYAWPGNVREMENSIERIVVLKGNGRVELRDLPAPIRQAMASGGRIALPGTLQDLERMHIVEILRETGGNKKLAARRLGIHRSTLYAKLARYGLGETAPRPEEPQEAPDDETLVPTS